AFACLGFALVDLAQHVPVEAPRALDGGAQPFETDRLEQGVDRIRIERGQGMFVVCGAEDDGRCMFERCEVVRRLEAVHSRHADIQQQNVGAQAFDQFDRFAAIACFGNHFDRADLTQQVDQSLARQYLIVGYDNPHCLICSGSLTVTVNSPRAGCTISAALSPKWYSMRARTLARACALRGCATSSGSGLRTTISIMPSLRAP